jgi:stearoyl-CoA desaturase (delta-9 desaturase)
MASCRQGFFWWEVDITDYILLGLQRIGLVWDIKEPSTQRMRSGMSHTNARLAA